VQWLTPVIPNSQEVEIKRIAIPGQCRQKVSENPSQQNKPSDNRPYAWWYMSIIPAMQSPWVGGPWPLSGPNPLPEKVTKAKKNW
jgi:hypothetical protein